MTARRDILAGLACLGALGLAEVLRPRNSVVLLPDGRKLTDLMPSAFGDWRNGGLGDIVVPRTEGTLATQLYSDQLARIYHLAASSQQTVMLSLAYGSEQSDSLQLHRPEACYPAIGMTVSSSRPVDIADAAGAAVPSVALTARNSSRIEDIIYWSRLGDAFVRTSGEQRTARLRQAMAGDIPDGILVRASVIRSDPSQPEFALVERFLADLIVALEPTARAVLLARN